MKHYKKTAPSKSGDFKGAKIILYFIKNQVPLD